MFRKRLTNTHILVKNICPTHRIKSITNTDLKIQKPYYSRKLFFDGKTYKLSIKRNIWHFRFNRVNRTILYPHNMNIYTKAMRKKIYIYNVLNKSLQRKINQKFIEIRKYNTYTIRGLYTTNMVINKRVGRISEYV